MKRSGVIYVASPLLTSRQIRILEWFCKEISKVIFLETFALLLVPSVVNVAERPSLLLLIGGIAVSLTLLAAAVILAKKGEQ